MIHELGTRISKEKIMAVINHQFGNFDTDQLTGFAESAAGVAQPKAVYIRARAVAGTGDKVWINGIPFASRILSVNLDGVSEVFPFVATCGMELENWAATITDENRQAWLSVIRETALRIILEKLSGHLNTTYHPGETSVMNPGSLADWPISQQQPLFELIGNVEKRIGVRLLASGMMVPGRTVSGIRFPSGEKFENCMLCPRKDCPIRRCPYNLVLYETKYRLKT